jgi:hypothetical protein
LASSHRSPSMPSNRLLIGVIYRYNTTIQYTCSGFTSGSNYQLLNTNKPQTKWQNKYKQA